MRLRRGEKPRGAEARGGEKAAAGGARLALEGVCVTYAGAAGGPVRALADVSLGAAPGVTALMGRTGSGKSTLLEIMAGARRPEAGRVLVDGADAARGAGAERLAAAAGLVLQLPERQFFEPTVEREVTFALRARGASDAEARAAAGEALATLGLDLDELGARSPFSLSGGQRRRVALASVLAARPRLLLLDEPTAGLDPRSRAACLGAVHTAAADGAAVVVATHDANAAAEVAGRLVVLEEGRVTLDGPARELLGDAPLMRAHGLEPCCAARAADALRAGGLAVPGAPLTADELAAAILAVRAS